MVRLVSSLEGTYSWHIFMVAYMEHMGNVYFSADAIGISLLRLAILLNSSILCCLLLGILRKTPTRNFIGQLSEGRISGPQENHEKRPKVFSLSLSIW